MKRRCRCSAKIDGEPSPVMGRLRAPATGPLRGSARLFLLADRQREWEIRIRIERRHAVSPFSLRGPGHFEDGRRFAVFRELFPIRRLDVEAKLDALTAEAQREAKIGDVLVIVFFLDF